MHQATVAGRVNPVKSEIEDSLEQLEGKVLGDNQDSLGLLVSQVNGVNEDLLETEDLLVQTEPLDHQVSSLSH